MEVSSVLSDCWDQPRCARGDRQSIAKIEMAMGCRGVGREEVGVKCGHIQGTKSVVRVRGRE